MQFIINISHCSPNESFNNDGTLETSVDWIPGMPNIPPKILPTFIRTTDPNDFEFHFCRDDVRNCLKSAHAVIFNTFDALEHQVLEAIKSKHPRIYAVGPLSLFGMPETEIKSLSSSLWKEDTKCLEWLEKQETNSVVYVNYGSTTTMTDQHLIEFAWSLANSNHPFLWIVRPDLVKGDTTILSEEFLKEIKDRGLIASWCPQDKVLNHPSVGAFLTHCGWNSMVESLINGVPMICWPFFAEQQTNCRYACNVWEIGMELSPDVKRDEIETLVREMMEGDTGKKMRKKAQEWKTKAKEAIEIGGSSYCNFDRFIKEALHCSK